MKIQQPIPNSTLAQKPKRASNMELLRILAMAFIVLCHIATHGILAEYPGFCGNSAFVAIQHLGGSIGDNLFILISGFFLVRSEFKFQKALKLFLQVTFYSIALYLAGAALHVTGFSVKKLVQSALPFLTGGGYWFIVMYMMLYFLSPLLNKGLKALTRNQLWLLIAFFGFVYIFVPRVVHQFISVNDFGASKFTWMVYVYSVGAAFRLWPKSGMHKVRTGVALAAVTILMLVMQVLRSYEEITAGQPSLLVDLFASRSMEGILVFAFSCLLFHLFLQIDMGYKEWINVAASTVFGVYLIHDHPVFKDYIWLRLFKIPQHQYDTWFPVYCLLIVLTIMVVCGCIDYARQKLFETPIFKSTWVNSCCEKLNLWLLKQ